MTKRPGDIILHMCTPNHMLHCSWDMAVVGCNCYFSFWPIFSPFTLLAAQKMKKKTPGGINANHKCNKNHDHMLYCSWDMVCEGCHCYHSFWANFCLFTPPSLSLTARKMKISKQWKKNHGYIIILQKCTKNHDHMLYCSWDIVHDRCNCCFWFWAIFCPFTSPFPLNSPKNENFKKMKKGKKTPADIILNKCTKNYDQMPYCSWDMVWRM